MKQEILLLVPEMSYTGAPESVLNMALVIQKMGYYVTVGTFANGLKREEFIMNGVYVITIDDSFFKQEKFHDVICKFSLCIANTVMLAKYIVFIQRYIPAVLLIREAQSIYEFGEIFQVNTKDIYQVKEIYCVSEYARQCIEDMFGITPEVLHNYVPDRYRRIKYTRRICKKDKLNFAIIGTIEERKGIHIAIEAFKQLESQIKEKCVLHIVGRTLPWQEEYWKPLLDGIKDSTNIFYHGEIKEKAELFEFYEQMDVIIVASRDESCSLVALEGAMMAKVLIVTNNTGAKYLINRTNGYVCITGDVKCLVSIIEKVYKIRKRIRWKGRLSRKQYLKTASEKVYCKQLSKLIKKYI